MAELNKIGCFWRLDLFSLNGKRNRLFAGPVLPPTSWWSPIAIKFAASSSTEMFGRADGTASHRLKSFDEIAWHIRKKRHSYTRVSTYIHTHTHTQKLQEEKRREKRELQQKHQVRGVTFLVLEIFFSGTTILHFGCLKNIYAQNLRWIN